jgi:hypothetical protein
MLHRSRPAWLAAGGALLLILSMSGIAAAATIVSDTTSGTQDTTLPAGDNAPSVTFVDLNGNGIDDTCETAVTPDGIAATAALTAADLDGDGAISVSEAAQSGWVGGTECNHGGYVSSVAKTSTDGCDQAGDSGDTTESADESSGDAADGAAEDSGDQATDTSTITTSTTTTTCAPTSTDTAPTVCPVVAPAAPTDGAAPVVDPASNAHGVAVSTVAQSDAVGGKNCDHGGAVSEAAKAAHGAKPDQAAKHAAHLAKHHGQGHGGQD